jgi:hypothetical protein
LKLRYSSCEGSSGEEYEGKNGNKKRYQNDFLKITLEYSFFENIS